MGAGDVLGKLLGLHPVHWTHGNAVINHTLCVFRWLIFQFPRSPVSCPSLGRYWCPAPDINRDSNVSSVKTDFRCKRSFLSIAGAKVQQFWVGNKFLGYRFFGGVCKNLSDSTLQRYSENQLLHFDRIGRKWRLVTLDFRKAVIWSWSFSVKIIFNFLPIMPPSMVTTSLPPRSVLAPKSLKAWKMKYMKSTAKEEYDTLAAL